MSTYKYWLKGRSGLSSVLQVLVKVHGNLPVVCYISVLSVILTEHTGYDAFLSSKEGELSWGICIDGDLLAFDMFLI